MDIISIQFRAKSSDSAWWFSSKEMRESRSRKSPGGPPIRKMLNEDLHVIVIMYDFDQIIQGQFSGKMWFP